MSTDRNLDESGRERESMNTGETGRRNRNTPGRTVSELGLDDETVRAHDLLGASTIGGGDARPGVSDDAATGGGNLAGTADQGGPRRNPPLLEDVATEEGGIGQSGGRSGGARGHAGTSDRGAGGPLGEMRSGPGQYKSTSRGDLDHGSDNTDEAAEPGQHS
jgi:hypothetical protein